MKYRDSFILLLILSIVWLIIYSCSKLYVKHDFRNTYNIVNDTVHANIPDSSFFKIHFKNGDVSLMDNWNVNSSGDIINGQGTLFNFNRSKIREGTLSFNIDEVAIIETNQLDAIKSKDKERVSVLTILTGINLIGDAICITNPKACFGSCPTFYLNDVSILQSAHAEGFSSSISPSLESRDLDAMRFSTSSPTINLTMKNEAYETHMLNELILKAVPKNPRDYVFHDKDNIFYNCKELVGAKSAMAGNKDISLIINEFDDLEYFSTTSSDDLTTKEEIFLEFENVPFQNPGLVINFRQTLVTTFLLYNGISYMGNEVGDYFAKIETNDRIKERISNPFKRLGKIKLFYWNDVTNSWAIFEELYETGPIAKNLMIAPLHNFPEVKDKIKIKIELTKGLWRLDYLGLASIQEKVSPISIYPDQLAPNNESPFSIDAIFNDDDEYLVTYPGDEIQFEFNLPELPVNMEHELFLSSKGYYLEWVRQNWIENKNLGKLKKMLLNDNKVWADLAREYKEIEPDIEQLFWNSKYRDCY